VQGNFDAEHLKLIHEYLFRDVYDWAGRLRTVSLAKADYVSGRREVNLNSRHREHARRTALRLRVLRVNWLCVATKLSSSVC
jgi:hypothetical protein